MSSKRAEGDGETGSEGGSGADAPHDPVHAVHDWGGDPAARSSRR